MNIIWLPVAVCTALALAPQLITRSASGDDLFDVGGGQSTWINRGVRIAAICTLAAIGALYLTSKV